MTPAEVGEAAWLCRERQFGSVQQFRQSATELFERLGVLGLALPHDQGSPAEFAERALMEFVAGGVAVPFRLIRRASLASLLATSKALVSSAQDRHIVGV